MQEAHDHPVDLRSLRDPAVQGLRERKKLATRDALVQAAVSLFAEQGVDGTTVDEIADRVGVSPRTFHRYFTSKEDVFFADSVQRRERFRAALSARPAAEPLLDSLRVVAREMTTHVVAHGSSERRRQNLLRAQPSLTAARLSQTAQWHQMVAEHAAARLGLDANDPLAVLLGATTSWAMRTALDHWLEFPTSDPAALVDQCFDLLGDLRTATSAPPPRQRRPQAAKRARR